MIGNKYSQFARRQISIFESFLDTCITSCNKTVWKPSVQSDARVTSEKHGIVGIVDRIADDGACSIIRAAGAMPFGTYASDRLRIACIAFCIEEMTGKRGYWRECGIYS